MASSRQSLNCTICLEPFKEPTILMCGHTFCRACLERHDFHNYKNNIDHIVCPICRGRTNLGQDRIAGLTPNLSLRDIQVEFGEDFCELHGEYITIFCDVCDKSICMTCFLDNHSDHNMKQREEIEEDLNNKQDNLIQNGRAKVAEIEEYVIEAEKGIERIECYFSQLEIQIRDAFAKKVSILEQNQERLLERLDDRCRSLKWQMSDCIVYLNYKILVIDSEIRFLAEDPSDENVGAGPLNHFYHRYKCCNFLEHLSKIKIDDDDDYPSTIPYMREAERAQFHPADDKMLDLGHLKLGGNVD